MKFAGPSRAYSGAYAELRRWVDANGYEVAGSAIEVYTKKPKEVGSETHLFARIEMPVQKR
jgi:effector-binding domain-containing protein